MNTDISQTIKATIYTRVSREEQVTGYSLDAQLDACRSYAAGQGWQIVKEFIEPGISGMNVEKRPAFQAMIRFALDGGCDVVLVHKYDRLNRSRFDAILYKQMLREKGIAVISVTEPGAESGPAGALVEGMLEVVAEWYSINLASEVRKGLKRKAASGQRPSGSLPLGYRRDGSWVTVTEQGAWIADAFTEFATGRYTCRTWANEAWQRGYRCNGKHIYAQRWQTIFRNHFYVGVIVYDGQEYQGVHTPLVDEDTFVKVQRILDSRPSAHSNKPRTYLLSGLLFSIEHDQMMTGMTAKHKYRYYRAKLDGQPEFLLPEPVIEAQVIDHLHRVGANGADLAAFPVALRLALQVAPNVGLVYEALEGEGDRRELLTQVVSRVQISGREVIKLDLQPGFSLTPDSRSEQTQNPGHSIILVSLLYAEVPYVA